MAQKRSQNYNVDNRYKETRLEGGGTAREASDNETGKKFLKDFIEGGRVAKQDSVENERKEDNKFVIPGQGGLVPIPDGNNIRNTDRQISFRNSFRAAQS